jgi:ferredoxin
MRVEVDLDKCTGHGICESIADDVFEVQDDGTVLIHENERPDSDRDRMQQAVTQSQLANRIRTLANERLDELLPRGTFDLT